MTPGLATRAATADDAPALAALYALHPLPGAPRDAAEAATMVQTGQAFLVAEDADGIAGAVRWRDEEGVGWFDLLVSLEPWAGRELVRAVERRAQDRGLRLLRCRAPEGSGLAGYFGRMGYLPVGRDRAEGEVLLVLERRLPLLTVREQRREDADAIAALTGEDPWPFAQGARPGWFVLADGEKAAGVVAAKVGRSGTGEIRPPVVAPGYRGRGLEGWMLERACTWAATHGAVRCAVAATPELLALRRELEDRRWFLEGDRFVREVTPDLLAT
ncbi:GNAT family N-acetyltransferase [Tepidiforma sp.]|uniref:GNAT family N-acetyltransferase n=1 Tax=Tepidiforma sp. TaxID=2682230 RepID=UPI002ADD8E7E|nr:GNAT family N-acetyltransferase [Tepidiforma sp.]